MSFRRGSGGGVVWKKRQEKKKKMIEQMDDHRDKGSKDHGKKKRYGLVSFRDLPDYMKDNEFILNYYRANWPLKQALFSVFSWHNETLNVWTHLLGFILFLGLTVSNLMEAPQLIDLLIGFLTRSIIFGTQTNASSSFKYFISGTLKHIDYNQITSDHHQESIAFDPSPQITTSTPHWPFFIFLAGSMFCLLSSSVCHLFSCHNHHLNLLLLRLDFAGITVMIITSFFPPIYYIFQCEPQYQLLYLLGITLMGIFVISSLLSPALSTSKYRGFRACLFSSMGLLGIVPAIHALVVNWSNPRRNIMLGYEAAMAVFYLTGALFYVSRVPERWRPGWFDLAGHSHQIFHVLVVMGALAHYGAALVLLEWRDTYGCEKIFN